MKDIVSNVSVYGLEDSIRADSQLCSALRHVLQKLRKLEEFKHREKTESTAKENRYGLPFSLGDTVWAIDYFGRLHETYISGIRYSVPDQYADPEVYFCYEIGRDGEHEAILRSWGQSAFPTKKEAECYRNEHRDSYYD